MEYEKPVRPASFSKKLSNGGVMGPAKPHPYDGLFVNGRSGKLQSSGAVVDDSDYAEIFRPGLTACSIPELDIPELFESASGGGRSSRPVDYSNIFGDSMDFAVPFEELLPLKPNNTRTPAETRTRSRGRSRQPTLSEEKPEPSRQPPEQLFSSVKEFNVSYNRTIPGGQNGESRTVRVPELHAVHSYTRMAGEAGPSQVTGVGGKPERSVVDNARVGDSGGNLPKIPKLSKRAVSGPQPRVAVFESSHSYAELRRRSGRSGSMSNDMFDTFESGVGAHPSGILSPLGTTSRVHTSACASSSNIPENKPGNRSPSFSDEDVDANSVAASSAAAVRKAIEEAQAKIKLAKEIMEKNKAGRVNFAKMDFGSGFKVATKVVRTMETLNSSRETEAGELNGKDHVPSFLARISDHQQRTVSQDSPELRDEKKLSTAQASGGPRVKGSSACLLDQTAETYGTGQVGTWGSQSVVATKHDSGTSDGDEINSLSNVTPCVHESRLGKNMKTEENPENLTECSKQPKVIEEDASQGKARSEIETAPGAFQWNFDANSFKSAQELVQKEEHELEVRHVHDLAEAGQAPSVAHQHGQEQEQMESKPDEFTVEGENIKNVHGSQGDPDMSEMSEAISGVETANDETEECNQNLADTGLNEVVIREGYEMRLRETNLLTGNLRELESLQCQENREDISSPGEDEYRESNGHWEQDNETKYVKICEESVVELRYNDLHGKEESIGEEGEDGVREHDIKETVAMGEQILDADHQMDMRENQLEGSFETDRMHSSLRTGDELNMEVPQKAPMDVGGKYVDAEAIFNQDEIANFRETAEGGWYEVTLKGVSVTAERMESPADANVTEESDKGWEAGDNANGTVKDDSDAVPHAQDFTSLEHIMQGSETCIESINYTESAAETAEPMESPADANVTEGSDKEWEAGEEANGTVENGFDAVPHAQVITSLEHGMQGSEIFVTMNNAESAAETAEPMESPADANITEESDKEWEACEDAIGTVEDGFDSVPRAQVFTSPEHIMQGSEAFVTMNNAESAAETAEPMKSPAGANVTEESDKEWEACEDAIGTEEDGFDAVPHAQFFTSPEHIMQGTAETDSCSHKKQGEVHLRGLLDAHDQETHVEEVIWELDESDEDLGESKVGCNEDQDETRNVSGKNVEPQAPCVFSERTVADVEENMMSSDVGETSVAEENEMASIHGEDDASRSSHEERQMDNQMHVETAEQPSSSEGLDRMTEVSLETKFQSTEHKEESHHKSEKKGVESQSEVGVQQKRKSEKDELREKERQRIVVDRAIKEARERAYAEARERAERAAADKAAAEARKRETAAAIKRPEKAPSEANGKLAADKATKDAKLKAERAAVERATNEARERALEKALAEKAAAKARNDVARTAAVSGASRDGASSRNNRSNDHQQNGSVTSSSSRQSSYAEKAGGPDNVNESAYWSKATFERHQRTAERAARALAEKNMRDLLAQREQAERQRLAETLDADVKKWSSGKERNLRALLSTLQYILGSDSGWQPIPLTDLVSTAAVKKAYRKATLVVHPDKLQQRGASVQQKYTCEKVFDILKEAWNKFSMMER